MKLPETKEPYPLVMLIDDSPIDNFVNKRIIARYNFAANVIEFTKARYALKYLLKLISATDEIMPSLIFLDLHMPEINGFEFLNTFEMLPEKIKNNIGIVILTCTIDPADLKFLKNYPTVLASLHKPLMKNNLITLEEIIKKNTKLVTF